MEEVEICTTALGKGIMLSGCPSVRPILVKVIYEHLEGIPLNLQQMMDGQG